jgi:hypothetical protein
LFSSSVLSECVLADVSCCRFTTTASTALNDSKKGAVGRKGGGLDIGVYNGIGLDRSELLGLPLSLSLASLRALFLFVSILGGVPVKSTKSQGGAEANTSSGYGSQQVTQILGGNIIYSPRSSQFGAFANGHSPHPRTIQRA